MTAISSYERLHTAPTNNDAGDEVAAKKVASLLALDLLMTVVGQKLALPLGGNLQISLPIVTHYLIIFSLIYTNNVRISIPRVIILMLFVTATTLTHAFYQSSVQYSPGSMFLLYITLAIYIFAIPMTPAGHDIILRAFQAIGIAASLLVFFNWGTQFLHLGIFNLEKYVPQKFLYNTYAYMNRLWWDKPWIKPNGIFFLEVSHLSQFIGMAIVIEVLRFRRVLVASLMVAALLCSFGGTGTLLLASSAPFLLATLPKRYRASLAAFALVAFLCLLELGAFDNLTGRLDEFSTPNSSGYNRFVWPALEAWEALMRPGFGGILGAGAGTIPATKVAGFGGLAWSPYCKVIYEYGLLGFLIWAPFTISCIFNRKLPFLLGWIGFFQYNFLNAALVVPIHTIYCYVLTGAYMMTSKVETEERPWRLF